MIGVWKVESKIGSPIERLDYSLHFIGRNQIVLWKTTRDEADKENDEIFVLDMSNGSIVKYPYDLILAANNFFKWNDEYYLCLLKNSELLVMSLKDHQEQARFSLLRSGEAWSEDNDTFTISLHPKCFINFGLDLHSTDDGLIIWHCNHHEPRGKEVRRLFILYSNNKSNNVDDEEEQKIFFKSIPSKITSTANPRQDHYNRQIDYIIEIKETELAAREEKELATREEKELVICERKEKESVFSEKKELAVTLLSGTTFHLLTEDRISSILGVTTDHCFFKLRKYKHMPSSFNLGIYSFETKKTIIVAKHTATILYFPPSKRECNEFSSKLVSLILYKLNLPIPMEIIRLMLDYLFLDYALSH